jgi:hypothetical protein
VRGTLLVDLIDRVRQAHDAAEEAGEFSMARRLLALLHELARALDRSARPG